VTSDQVATTDVADTEAGPPASGGRRGLSYRWFALIGGAIIVNILAFILFPPFPHGGAPGDVCAYPACFIQGTLEFPAPATIIGPTAPADALITFTPSISSTILTQWLVMIIVVVGAALLVRGSKLIPSRGQNVFEWFYEFISEFGVGIAGPTARPYVPLFVSFFLLILF